MDRERFEQLVAQAVESLPGEFLERMENIDLVVEDYPSAAQLRSVGLRRRDTLLGLYEGVPLVRRGAHYGMVAPDKITIFQKPVEARCRSESAIRSEIRDVVIHEIAHHFGISDARMRELRKRKG